MTTIVGRLAARPAAGLAVTCGVSALVVCLLVGPVVLLHPGRAAVGLNPASDFQVMAWSLEWWPWAALHGVDPLRTHLLWPPEGFSTLWMTTIPAPALLALPLTLTAGPLVAYNVLILVAVPLAAGAAYLLCRELTGSLAASLVGGLLFGFSPYLLGHTLSQHLNLTFVFPVPLLALLAVRYARGKTSARRFVGGFAALLLVVLGSSFELFLDLALLIAVGLVLALLGGGRRRVVAHTGALVGLAYAVCLPVLVPIAVFALSAAHTPLRYSPSSYATDLLNLVVPTPTLLAGTLGAASAVSRHFVGNIGERDGYLGLPLLLVALLAVRAEWRRGAWLVGGLLLAAFLLSLGPTLTVGGHPFLGVPFAVARLPLLGDALPARMSLFAGLAAACLCALWLARPRKRALRLGVGLLVLLSLLPNFWPAPRLPGAWSASAAFGWATPHVPVGFVDSPAWTQLVAPGSTVLVLPTAERTAAGYWQAKTGMRFALAIPVTPFPPPQIAAAPVVRGLVNDDLRIRAGRVLAAARLRAFLLADRVQAVVVTSGARRRWSDVVADATATRPVTLRGAAVYRVKTTLEPLHVRGSLLVAHPVRARAQLSSNQGRGAVLITWLRFDGRRAEVRGRLDTGNGKSAPAITLSSRSGDADNPIAAAVDDRGHAAVAFIEWRNHHELLRIATRAHGRWRVATLDEQAEPISSPHVVITTNGTTLATWISDANPTRLLRADVLPPDRNWQPPVTLENADGLATVALRAGRGNVVAAAWHDVDASEWRVRVAIYNAARWNPVVTLARSLDTLDRVELSGDNAALVRWRRQDPFSPHPVRFEARRRGSSWIELPWVPKLPSCLQIADFSGHAPSFDTPHSARRVWRISYRSHDGTTRRAYVDVPANYARNGPRLPLIISPHGRGLSGRINARLWGDLPTLGQFVVVNPDGQGRRLGLFSWGYRGQIEDLARMPSILTQRLPWLRIDRTRIFAFGGSMGGQEVLLLAARYPRLLAGAAVFDSVGDLGLQYQNFPLVRGCDSVCRDRWRMPLGEGLQQLARSEVGGSPSEVPRAYAERSPITFSKRLAFSRVPIEFWWSRSDQVVVEQARQSGRVFWSIKRLNPQAPVEAFVGRWIHSAEMSARSRLPFALEGFGLLPDELGSRSPYLQFVPPPPTWRWPQPGLDRVARTLSARFLARFVPLLLSHRQ